MRVVKKWELTRGALDRLLAALDADPSAAGEKYEQVRRALLRFFSWHGVPDPDACVDDTIDRIARRLEAEQTIDDIPTYAHGVARLVRLERQRRAAATPLMSDDALETHAAAPSSAGDREERRDACLQRCLGQLQSEERALIVGYYVGAGRDRIDARARLAARLGLRDTALRNRAQRLRDRLKACTTGCLESTAEPPGWPQRHEIRRNDSTQ
ncbi:MAG: RNA polymerase sigma factor [Vicinamibacterales bacterium]